MRDVLSLVGAAEFPPDSIGIEQVAGLQSQLDAKASLQALSLASEAIGAELDGVETQVSAVGAAVTGLGSLVASKADASALSTTDALVGTKASQVQLSAVKNYTLSGQLNTLASALGGKASTASLTEGLLLKQDAINDTLLFSEGVFRISSSATAFSIQRLIDKIQHTHEPSVQQRYGYESY
jgi:hypothetical protein